MLKFLKGPGAKKLAARSSAASSSSSTKPGLLSFSLSHSWLDKAEADELFKSLLQLDWQEETIKMFGKDVLVPRKVLWFGDVSYRYAGTDHLPTGWPEPLRAIKSRLEKELGCTFHGCLGNYYADGKQYMGWHADDEKSIDAGAPIASVSL